MSEVKCHMNWNSIFEKVRCGSFDNFFLATKLEKALFLDDLNFIKSNFDDAYLSNKINSYGVKLFLKELLAGTNRILELHVSALMMKEIKKRHSDRFIKFITQYKSCTNAGFQNQLKATFYVCRLLKSISIEKKNVIDSDVVVNINEKNVNVHITTADMHAKESLQFAAHMMITSRLAQNPITNPEGGQLSLVEIKGIIPRLLSAEEVEEIIKKLPGQTTQSLHIQSKRNDHREEISLIFDWVFSKIPHHSSLGVDHYRNIFYFNEGLHIDQQGYFFRLSNKIKSSGKADFLNLLLIVGDRFTSDAVAMRIFREFLDSHQISGVIFLSYCEAFDMNLEVIPTHVFRRIIICKSSESSLENALKKSLPDFWHLNPCNLEVVTQGSLSKKR